MSERREILEPLRAGLPGSLGCGARWVPIRDAKLGPGGGRADLVVVSDEPSIVIVEAKLHANAALKDAVVGQTLLYYVTALTASSDEVIEGFRRAATGRKPNGKRPLASLARDYAVEEAEVIRWVDGARARARAHEGGVRAVVATNAWDEKRDMRRLGKIVRFLAERGISLDVAVVSGDGVSWPLNRQA